MRTDKRTDNSLQFQDSLAGVSHNIVIAAFGVRQYITKCSCRQSKYFSGVSAQQNFCVSLKTNAATENARDAFVKVFLKQQLLAVRFELATLMKHRCKNLNCPISSTDDEFFLPIAMQVKCVQTCDGR